MTAKKVLVIGLMAVLLLSVLVSAISVYTRSSSPSPSIKQAEAQLNDKINQILDICTRSLPNGIPACDNQLRDGINKVCESNNKLDACHDGRVNQYYTIRNEARVTINNNNRTDKQ
jgi:hypothetical protein